MSSASATSARRSGTGERIESALDRFERPTTTYYLLLTVTSLLTVFGLVMVLSASSVSSIKDGKSAYTVFLSQALYAVVGAVAFWVASRIPAQRWKALAFVILLVGIALQALVPFIGREVSGNKNWLQLGPVGIQPSEILKVGLALVGGVVLAPRRRMLHHLKVVVVPYLVPIVLVSVGLVLAGKDLGTTLVLAAVVAGCLFTAGVPTRWFVAAGGVFAAGVVALVVFFPNRMARFDVWLGKDTDIHGAARQTIMGKYALADGGWFGLGLGGGREKWGWLSAAHNDFIFAVIGEELGLPGTLAVLVLFLTLVYACYRIVVRSTDPFVRIATGGIAAWVAVQASINIGSVTGLFPVVGLPLPLVSSGGSSLITTLFALGILVSFAKSEPGCAEAMRGRGRLLGRLLPARGKATQ